MDTKYSLWTKQPIKLLKKIHVNQIAVIGTRIALFS